MKHEIQRPVMTGLSLVVAVGAGACLPPPGVACGDEWCSDRESCVSLGSSGDEHLVCVTKTIGQSCKLDMDCAPVGICDAGRCRVAQSCAEFLQHVPGSKDGVYSIAPGTTAPFSAVCDMTRGGGGWTLLLKANGDAILGYSASAWTDASLLNPTDLTTGKGNAKYQSFLSLPISTLRGELDVFPYTYPQNFARMTAQQIFNQPATIMQGLLNFHVGAANWSTQPHCQVFGVNIPYEHTRTRFGWSANEQDDCTSNDTAIGLGLMNDGMDERGAGYECEGPECSPYVDTGGQGLLWGR